VAHDDTAIFFNARLKLSPGEDRGQALGTLVEYEAQGLRLSIGFPNAAQTRGTLSCRHIEIAARREGDEPEFSDLGRPWESAWRPDLRNSGSVLVDTASSRALTPEGWQLFAPANPVPDKPLCNIIPVGLHELTFPYGVEQVFYGSRPVLAYPGSIRTSAYYNGQIAVAHVDSATSRAWITLADWTPADETARNIRRYHWIAAADVYAMIGWRGSLWITDGADASPERIMRLYQISTTGIRLAAEYPHAFRSGNEGYGMMVCGERLLIGHYPSGLLLAYDGASLEPLSFGEELHQKLGLGLNPYAYGESQTLALYGGEVWVGHYPWGYLLRSKPDLAHWTPYTLFRGPDARPNTCPYRDEVAARIAAVSAETGQDAEGEHFYDEMWARRVHSAAWYGNGLALGLASRRGTVFNAERDAGIDPEELADYGSVRLIEMPNTLVARFPWPATGEMELTVRITAGEIRLLADGALIASRPHTLTKSETASLKAVSQGKGIYGECEVPLQIN